MLYGKGQMTLGTAVARVMALPIEERAGATIFRDGKPSILDLVEDPKHLG